MHSDGIIIIPFHDSKWLDNSLANINRQSIKCDYLFVVNNNTVIDNCINQIGSLDSHADAVNAGVQYAKEHKYQYVILFDSDDYYGSEYAVSNLNHLQAFDYVGKQQIYTQFSDGIYHFTRDNRKFLFATIAAKTDKFLPVKNLWQNCDDWCSRMNNSGCSYLDTGSNDYCYLRHGNNKHFKSSDVFVKKFWNGNRYYPAATSIESLDKWILPYEITDAEIFSELECLI